MENTEIKKVIKNPELILDHFGYWPTFHDDRILDISSNYKNRTINLVIDSKVKISTENSCNIHFLFKGVKSFNVDYYEDVDTEKTIISEIEIKKIDNNFIKILINPKFGLIADILCAEIEIENIEE